MRLASTLVAALFLGSKAVSSTPLLEERQVVTICKFSGRNSCITQVRFNRASAATYATCPQGIAVAECGPLTCEQLIGDLSSLKKDKRQTNVNVCRFPNGCCVAGAQLPGTIGGTFIGCPSPDVPLDDCPTSLGV